MSKFEFVEKIMTEADQKAQSKIWYGDENFSDQEAQEETKEIIRRNGREFTFKGFDEIEDFKFVTASQGYGCMADIALFTHEQPIPSKEGYFDEDGCFDTAFYINSDDNFYYFEGDLQDFIYQVPKCKLPADWKPFSILSVFDNPTYSPDRFMSDYDMDTLL